VTRWPLVVGGSGFAVGLVAFVVAGLLLRGGISARVEPAPFEGHIARSLRTWAIPADSRAATNPVPVSPQVIAEGLAHFADHCASCHGNDGSGQTPLGRNLYPRPPDMRRAETQALTDGELFYIIENGVRFTGMPAWGGPGTAEGSWHLVHFIRHLPKVTGEERVQMEALNPKSPDEWRALQDEESFLRGGAPPPEPNHGAPAH
jgi:mono/diheme cytochrome c family protein